ncbi:heavy metal-binding domain-containing protein [Streptomyces manipurensis]|uniref:heavy metal-binding domain-containing protein n=1 Tax=Streptomyces manipurensis TaxID=1077945 RepID=UPI003C6FB27B
MTGENAATDRKLKKEFERKRRILNDMEDAAHDASGGLYSITLDAPPFPHTALGMAVGELRATPMQAVVSMQEHARELGADGVLGVAICADPQGLGMGTSALTPRFVAYGTAVQWARSD